MNFTAVMTIALASMSACTQAGIVDNPGDVTLALTQTPAAWYTDRYAPQGFDSGVMFDGDYRLRLSLLTSGIEGNRGGGLDAGFYNYQGRKYDVGASTKTAVSINLYIDGAWASGTRAGMWTTMSNESLAYPIIECVVDGDNSDGNGATYEWYIIDIELAGTLVNFSINGTSIGSVDNQGAHMIDNVILNAHNQ